MNENQTKGKLKNVKLIVKRNGKKFYTTPTVQFVKSMADDGDGTRGSLYFVPADKQVWQALTLYLKLAQDEYGWDLLGDPSTEFYIAVNGRHNGTRYETELNVANYAGFGGVKETLDAPMEELGKQLVGDTPFYMPELPKPKTLLTPLLARLFANAGLPVPQQPNGA